VTLRSLKIPAIPLRTVTVTRYITPLREGGSVPAIIEGDDDGMYVLKFRGAAQGVKTLIAELIAGEIARALQLPVPEIVFVDVDCDLARAEPDPEIQSAIRASGGRNLALDYLPGAITFDPVADQPSAELASAIVWFDAFVTNVDRTPRNTNMLMWHRRLHLIDHGACLYFHHSWDDYLERAASPFSQIRDHVLLPFATQIEKADQLALTRLDEERLRRIVALVPDDWLQEQTIFPSAQGARDAYVAYLSSRVAQRRVFVEEAIRARS
jgi:hypothetical protein